MKLSWARKLRELDRSLTWVQLLEANLREATRPNISTHFKLSVQEWKLTATKLGNITEFWADVFSAIADIISLSHKFDKQWHLIPISGHEDLDYSVLNIASLTYSNITVRQMT